MASAKRQNSESASSESGFDSLTDSPPPDSVQLPAVKSDSVSEHSNVGTCSPTQDFPGPASTDSGISSSTSPNAAAELELEDTVQASNDSIFVRSSARVHHLKTMKSDSKKESELPAGKMKRAWEQWSSEDKVIFFEALNECGKNFDAMQVFFQKKNRKNKNKEQIRTFYYRTWHKICKYVDFSDNDNCNTQGECLKKSSKELYGLINFGELRKRLGSQLDDKTGMKLRELIFKGHTNVRIKGKTYRLRTPTCAALKKLSSCPDGTSNTVVLQDFTTVPSKLVLNLAPCTSSDFDLVHRLSQANPHVSLSLRPGRSLASVMGMPFYIFNSFFYSFLTHLYLLQNTYSPDGKYQMPIFGS